MTVDDSASLQLHPHGLLRDQELSKDQQQSKEPQGPGAAGAAAGAAEGQ